MQTANLYAAWIGIFLGIIVGVVIGLFFHNEGWMGGYSSWRRRMIRLGHVSFFGIALINFAYALSIAVFNVEIASSYSSYLFIAGAVTMPLICFLCA